MLSGIASQLLALIEQVGYAGILIAMFLENLFPPIPSELIMPFAGFLAGQGKLDLWLVILTGVIGTYLGVLPFYLVGRRGHKERVLLRTERYGKYLGITREEIQKAFAIFHRRGYTFVLVGRFIPLFRTVISFPAGAVRMSFWRYSVYTLIGSFIRSSMLAYLGYIVGDEWPVIGAFLSKYEHLILGAFVILFLRWIGTKIHKKIKKRDLKREEQL